MRKFELVNSKGARRNLTAVDAGFFHSVSGLGYSDDTEYRRIEDAYALISDHRSQDEIKGKVIFRNPGAHKAYREFINFLQFKPLILKYTPEGESTAYCRKGTVTRVDFTETDHLQATVVFTSWTPPYKYLTKSVSPDAADGGKQYSYQYNYTYRSSSSNTVVFDAGEIDTAMLCPCKISIYGPFKNPAWFHYVNNVLVTEGKVYATIPSGKKLVIDTEQTPYSIKEYDMNNILTRDLYELSKFDTQRFCMLRNGTNRITISDDDANVTDMVVEAQVMYASV